MSFYATLIALILVCTILSFLFSGMEAGVFSLSRVRIRHQMRLGNKSARLLHEWLEKPEPFLWTILLGNALVNCAILVFLVTMLRLAFDPGPVLFAILFLVAVFLFYAVCDLLPKMLFRMFPNRLCMAMARPFRLPYQALRPLVALVEWCSRTILRWTGGKALTGTLFGHREELRLAMQDSAQNLSSEERTMIMRVMDLQSRTVGQVATPFDKAVSVDADMPASKAIALYRDTGHTRLPVWGMRDRERRIVGVLNVESLLYTPDLNPEQKIADFVRPAIFFEDRLRLEVAVQRLQRSGLRLAVVLDPDGRETGVVSHEDILKMIFGEVRL